MNEKDDKLIEEAPLALWPSMRISKFRDRFDALIPLSQIADEGRGSVERLLRKNVTELIDLAEQRLAKGDSGWIQHLEEAGFKLHKLESMGRDRKVSSAGNDAKREKSLSNVKQAAGHYQILLKQHPTWGSAVIFEQVRAKMNCTRRTLDDYLKKARQQGLIPPRHRRTPSK